MAQWTILLFSLYGALHGQVNGFSTEHQCCQDGKDRALDRQDCTDLPLISSPSDTCKITQEQCCAAAVGDRLCDNGIEMATYQGACERPFFQGEFWETQISKMCCDCCVIGLITAKKGSSCEFQGLMMDRKCAYTAKACCDNSTAAETQPDTNVNQLPIEQKCCQNGKDWAQERHDCTYLPVIISSSHTCRLTQEQCCAAAVGDQLCDNGIEVAKGQSACFMSFFRGEFWETQISKMCCDCCVIGLITLNKGSSCEFQGLLMDRKCAYTAKACCDNSTAVETEPNTNDRMATGCL
ncbi:fibulin-1-like [Anarhichas minor]|uniref:fibulin-1-like n=1 Tax=Anarhichas minor TaxID=65739 RepID=UPI003F7324E7